MQVGGEGRSLTRVIPPALGEGGCGLVDQVRDGRRL